MYLKKIIISGFKSFADRITISLEKEHITGIVGPNGSGKSNVIDSVRWVMGEQNAKMLRGEKATDIIFSGSERRKPLGMAEVTLVFDNAAGSEFCPPEYRHEPEIALTRRLYIDGQREYLINKKTCRLKDLVEFFTATGLGGRSYSMIQQGQVDRILQAKPEQLREILEEAAGTLIFKKRKGEAEKKLEATRQNLSRIDDIITELDRQKETLTEQVEKARKWQEISDELKEKETTLLLHNHRHFSTNLKECDGLLMDEKMREVELVNEITHYEGQREALQEQLDDADPEVQALNESIAILREKIASSEASLLSAMQLIEGGDERLIKLAHEIEEEAHSMQEMEEKVTNRSEELEKYENDMIEVKEMLESFQEELDSANEEAQVFDNKLEESEDEIRNLERLINSNFHKRESVEKDLANSTRDFEGVKSRILSLENELAQAMILVEASQVKVSSRKKGLDAEIEEKTTCEKRVAERNLQIVELSEKRDHIKEEYLGAKAKHASLVELDANADDITSLVSKLKEDEELKEHVLGLMTDFVSFTEKVDELSPKALASFETWTERLVVKDVNSFNTIAKNVASEAKGVLPAILLDEKSIDASNLSAWLEITDAEPSSHFISLDENAPAGLSSLLERIYFVPSIMLDEETLAKAPRGIIALSAQGTLFTSEGDLVIGSKGAQGALSRKNVIQELAEKIKGFQASLAATQGEIDTLELQQRDDRNKVAEIDATLQSQNQAVLEVMGELQKAQQQADLKQELVISAREDYIKLEENKEKYATELQTLIDNASSLEEEKDALQQELDEIRETAEERIERRAEVNRQMEQKRLDLNTAEVKISSLRDSYRETKEHFERMQEKISRRYEDKNNLEEQITAAKANHGDLQNDIESFIIERERKEEVLAEKREENAGIIEEMRVFENKLKEHRSEQSKLTDAISKRHVEIERLRLALESVTSQAEERYHLNLEEAEYVEIESYDPTNEQRNVTRLKNKIDGMGPINPMAIEEYDKLIEREDFIIRQREEVISSVDLLELAIEEIATSSQQKFLATFETLNQEFQSLFPILFPGGDADLQLTNPEVPLDGGVEILVRLPGKKRQNMRLFSGGEKALTAIALIFALLKSKPTPFCFLDEVDAPLDETNVGRYNRVLQSLSDRFQFIVITHNRRTMEVLDTLFGVTMQEPGVSKVVGVDMTKEIPAHLKKAFKDTQINKLPDTRPGATAQ